MKKFFVFLLLTMFLLSSTAWADTYSLEEIIPSIPALTNEELDSLLNAITAEKALRVANPSQEVEVTEPTADDDTPITERDDYVERVSIQRGSKGDEAKAVQEKLIELGFLGGTADGDFGKKSEAAVKAFQKANSLEETGIADSITQYVLFSDNAVDKEAFDNMPIAKGDGWEMINEYIYNTHYYHYYIFTLKNTSGYNAKISVNVTFYDSDDNVVGVANDSENACQNGYITYWSFSNDMKFDHAVANITMSEETWYGDGGQSCVEISTNTVGKKVIITAKNNGNEPVQFLEYHVLFFNNKGEVVSTGWGYLTDDDSELKPGATEMRDESYSKGFADVAVYTHGRISR